EAAQFQVSQLSTTHSCESGTHGQSCCADVTAAEKISVATARILRFLLSTAAGRLKSSCQITPAWNLHSDGGVMPRLKPLFPIALLIAGAAATVSVETFACRQARALVCS